MDDTMQLQKHFDGFNKIILDLTAIGVELDQEHQSILLLSSLPNSYEQFVDTMLYGKNTLILSL